MINLPIIPMVNAGDSRQIGMGYAGHGWEYLFHSTTRVKPNTPTIREWANRFGCLHLHNPGGIFDEAAADEDTEGTASYGMKYEQRLLATELALRNLKTRYNDAQNPWEVVAKRVDWLSFIEAGQGFPHDLTCYVGAPHRFERIGQESQASWLWRATQAIQPFLMVAKTIGLDNTLGSKPYYDKFYRGKLCVIADLVKAINDRGVKVAIEPANYVSDTWLNGCGKIVSERFIRDRTRLNAGKSVWDDRVTRIPKGSTRAIDHEPLAIPGTYGEPVSIIAGAQNGWNESQMRSHLEKLHADYPHAKLLVRVNQLPVEWAA